MCLCCGDKDGRFCCSRKCAQDYRQFKTNYLQQFRPRMSMKQREFAKVVENIFWRGLLRFVQGTPIIVPIVVLGGTLWQRGVKKGFTR